MCMSGGRFVDAARRGNVARFVNHSCDPNCRVEEWTVNGRSRMGLFAARDIAKGEELSFNYNFKTVGEGDACKCGSASCVGVLGSQGGNDVAESVMAALRPKRSRGCDPFSEDYVGVVMPDATVKRHAEALLGLSNADADWRKLAPELAAEAEPMLPFLRDVAERATKRRFTTAAFWDVVVDGKKAP